VGVPSGGSTRHPVLVDDGSDRFLAGLDVQEARGPTAAGGAYELGYLVEDRADDRRLAVLELLILALTLLDTHPYER
jgi:hypothetical protein